MRHLSIALAVAVFVAQSGCSDRDRPPPPRDPPRQRRVIEPPTRTVRPQPPYAIRADGVGPYRLGDKLSDLLEQLPSGPRIALFDIPNLLHRSLIRAEDDTVLIGGEPTSTATFIAVVGKDVARTESGIHVGSTKDELARAIAPSTGELDRARDPRMIAPTVPGNARIILDEDRVVAIVVSTDTASPTPRIPPIRDGGTDASCPRPAPTEKAFGACLTGVGELVEVDGDDVTVRAPESERALTLRIPNLVFAAALRNPVEGRDELVAITRTDDAQLRSWSLVAYRFEGQRFVRAVVDPSVLYQVSASNARWIGAELRDLDLYLELTSRPDAIEVGGLLTTHPEARPQTAWRDVVVISPVSVARRHGKSAGAEGSDAGVVDAPAEAAPGSASGAKSPKP